MSLLTRLSASHGTSTRDREVMVSALDGFPVGRLCHVRESKRSAHYWVVRVSPLAFDTTGLSRVPRELYAPVEGSDYLPGQYTRREEAHEALEAHLREHGAQALAVVA